MADRQVERETGKRSHRHNTQSSIKRFETKLKDEYTEQWQNENKIQHKLLCYQSLNRDIQLAEYLKTKNPKEIRILTKYRVSDHELEIERGRHLKVWRPREERVCTHCHQDIKTELHFLCTCPKYEGLRTKYFQKFEKHIPGFTTYTEDKKLPFLLGEDKNTAWLAAKYVFSCHNTRNNK